MAAAADKRDVEGDDEEASLEADEEEAPSFEADVGVDEEEDEEEEGESSTFGIRFARSKSCSSRIAVPAASAASFVRSKNSWMRRGLCHHTLVGNTSSARASTSALICGGVR